MPRPPRSALPALALAALAGPPAADPAPLALAAPTPFQVAQRVGFDPAAAAPGFADVTVRGAAPAAAGDTWEYRVVRLAGGAGAELGWTRLDVRTRAPELVAVARVPAGGWYRLDVRCRRGDEVTRAGAVEPVGVGEVLLVAGQSYATNCNDAKLAVADPAKRVAAFDAAKGTWAVANDPQPVPDGSADGSIWPPVGDALVAALRVPVGFANVGVGATSSAQWLPGGPLHNRLVAAGAALGRFRAVLWQQGESDVIAKTTTETYVANVRAIRRAAAAAWAAQPPWLLAKSTLHPTVYTDPAGEGRVRAAVDALAARPGFRPGPDTDTLAGEYRGGATSRRHFSAAGQAKAAELWAAVLAKHLAAPPAVEEMLPDLRLRTPLWTAPVVHRESSVLFKAADGAVTARLAFPAAEVLEVASADGRHRYDRAALPLSEDGRTLTFPAAGPVEPIALGSVFVPKGTPQSYAARVGHPEQSLLYRPGRWFHDRNVEVTYRRRDPAGPPLDPVGSLPRTLARLKAGGPLTVGVSGDSISTGVDASGLAKAAPHQPGFPDLVAADLRATFDCPVVLKNRAVGGWSVANGVADLDKLLAEKPNLVIVAYGMNDVGRRNPGWFGEQTKTILARIRAHDPATEVILVAPMLGHAEWTATPREMFPRYRDELRKLTGPGVALADATAVWERLLRHKHDFDLTGNGLNHPNDCGHRLYAQVILTTLPAE